MFLIFASLLENPSSILVDTLTHSNNVQTEKKIYRVPCTSSWHHESEKFYNKTHYHVIKR